VVEMGDNKVQSGEGNMGGCCCCWCSNSRGKCSACCGEVLEKSARFAETCMGCMFVWTGTFDSSSNTAESKYTEGPLLLLQLQLQLPT